MPDAPTQPSFPTYAALTETQGWDVTATSRVGPTGSANISGERYTEGQVLGVGGMGKVVLARDARTFTIVLQAHPSGFIRRSTWMGGVIALTALAIIELAYPMSYVEVGEALAIMPRTMDLPREGSIMLLLCASLGMTIVPCLFIGRIREALNQAQRQILTQAWQFRRFGEDLVQTRSGVK